MDNSPILADHPLLAKFQQTLFEHMTRVNASLKKELAEIDFSINTLSAEREDIGTSLYDLQQELEHQRNIIDNYNEQIKDTFEKRIQCEDTRRELEKEYFLLNNQHKEQMYQHRERMAELDQMQAVEINIDKFRDEYRNELEISKRVVSKDKQDKLIVSKEKKKMDFILLNLESELRRYQAESDAINEQKQLQEENLDILKSRLADANADLDALQTEQKRLIASWNDVIYAVEKRNNMLGDVQSKLDEENQKCKVIQTNIEAVKKEANREMEQNEKLENFKMRLTEDLQHTTKQLQKSMKECDSLTSEIVKSSALIEENETALNKSTTENQIIEAQLKSLTRELERQTNKKIELEEKILEMLQDQIMTDQASKKQAKNVREVQTQRRELEMAMFATENQLAEILFELEKVKGIVARSKLHVEDLTRDKYAVEKKSAEYEDELKALRKTIDSKLKTFDVLNKQLAQLIEAAGGAEKDPMESKITDLERTIAEIEVEIRDGQNQWIRLQNNIVNMSEQHSQQLNEIHLARQQLLIIEQKLKKIDIELSDETEENVEIVRDIKNLNTKLDQISSKLFEKKQNHENEESRCKFTHMAMMDKLKASEMSILKIEDEINALSEEIEDLKIAVMEKHREALSWETKWKMMADVKKEYDQEYAKTSEIGAMKSEIHRMEVRYAQLKRAQEKLVQDMENCVQHRDHIYEGANIRSKLKKPSSVNMKQQRFNDVKAKLKQILTEINAAERQIVSILGEKGHLEQEINRFNETIDDERMQFTLLQNEIEQTTLLKQENLENIVRLQHRAKRYRNLTVAQQLPKMKMETTIDNDLDRHHEINLHLISVLEALFIEFPDQKGNIERALQTLKGA